MRISGIELKNRFGMICNNEDLIISVEYPEDIIDFDANCNIEYEDRLNDLLCDLETNQNIKIICFSSRLHFGCPICLIRKENGELVWKDEELIKEMVK